MQMYPQRLGTIYTNVSPDGVYNIRCGSGCVGKDRRGYSDISPRPTNNNITIYQY